MSFVLRNTVASAGYLYYETCTMEKGLRENAKEENMEDDGGVKMRRRRYETETRSKV